jgi:hypothetical protein
MKMIQKLTGLGMAGLAVVLVAGGFLATAANAQSRYVGRFTLQCKASWAGHILPAGEYTITVPPQSDASYILVRAVHGTASAILAAKQSGNKSGGKDELLITSNGEVCVVRSLNLAALDMEFVYSPLSKEELATLKRDRAERLVALEVARH